MRITPPTDKAGVIRGGRGRTSASLVSDCVPFVAGLPDGDVAPVADAMPSDTVEDGWSEFVEVLFVLVIVLLLLDGGGVELDAGGSERADEVGMSEEEGELDCEVERVGSGAPLLSCRMAMCLLV